MQFINPEHILALFPIPVVKIPFDNSFDYTQQVEILKTLEMRRTDGGSSQSHGASIDNYCLDLDPLKELRGYVESKISAYMKDVLSFNYPGQLTQSWVNRNDHGEPTHLHGHPNSIVSGVFYMDIPNTNGALRFHKNQFNGTSRTWLMEPSINKENAATNFYAFDWIDISVSTGDIILFPSYLPHSVPAHNDITPRWSLAFNSVPIVGLGDADSLNELKLRATHG
jgi:uncharacterized protein (TIGR02466 family)